MRRPCEWCGVEFVGQRSSARYCSGGCKQAAWRERVDAEDGASGGRDAGVETHASTSAGLVAEAVEASPRAGLAAVASWLATTLDQLEGASRGVHGPRVAAQLTAVLRVLRAQEAAGPAPVSQLQRIRDARAASDARYGR